MGTHSSVSERIEHVRQEQGLNKARFSHTLGIKPRTYNKFTGKPGSRPNMDLVLGIVTQFNVNPAWLLFGTGPVYLQGNAPEDAPELATALGSFNPAGGDNATAKAPNFSGLSESDWLRLNVLREIGSLQLELQSLADSCTRISNRIGNAIDILDSTVPGAHNKRASRRK